jgi:hypothetical protein
MRHAYNKVGSEEAGFDKEQDEDTRDLFSVYFEHVHKNQDYFRTGKKTSGLRFDPLLFNFALLILARTSHNTYNEIGKVMLLPSLSMVSPQLFDLDLTKGFHDNSFLFFFVMKDIFLGSQKAKRESWETRRCELWNTNRVNRVNPGTSREGRILTKFTQMYGALAFDSMKIVEGISHDIHNDFSGIDQNTRFDVVTREFGAMADEVNPYSRVVSIIFLSLTSCLA